MKGIKYSIFILLFSIFSLRILIHWMPLLGYPLVSTACVLVEYVCLLYLLYSLVKSHSLFKIIKQYKLLYALYLIYHAYLVYYIMINPLMSRSMMAHVPADDSEMLRSVIVTGLIIPVVINYQRYFNFELFAKVSTLFISSLLLVYCMNSDMSLYIFQKTLSGIEFEEFSFTDYKMIDGLTMSVFCSMAFLFNFVARNTWSKRKLFNRIIFFSLSAFLLFLLFVFSQRGPVLWMMVTLLFYLYTQNKLTRVIVFFIAIIAIVVFPFEDQLKELLSQTDYSLIDRFMDIREDEGSGRYGSNVSEYNLAIKQIMGEPFFGTYFRTLSSYRLGHYAHNFILELLMTFGIVFTIPFLLVFWRAVKKSYISCKRNLPNMVFCLIFINVYACHLTSYSFAFDYNMWILLAMVLCYDEEMRNVKTLSESFRDE